MELLDLTAALTCLIAGLAFANAKFFRLPATVGVTIGGLVVSILLVALAAVDVPFALNAVDQVADIELDVVVFQGVLSFLLFAGALGLDTHELWRMRASVLAFSLIATVLSIGLVGGLVYGLFLLADVDISLTYCLLFGAVISPTDPVAVLGMLKHAKVPHRIETLVAGESLFNDGVGVVAFSVLVGLAVSGPDGEGTGALEVAGLFAQEALGGLVFGLAIGYLGLLAVRSVEDFATEMMITLGLVLAITAVAPHLHVSAPLAAVAAGLLVGMLTDRRPDLLTNPHEFESVWNLIDELLNAALFTLLALKVISVELHPKDLLLGVIGVPLVLLARTVSVTVTHAALDRHEQFSPYTRTLLIWGGLRGALAVALAFSVPAGPERTTFLEMTYVIVVFSILAQALTVPALARRAAAAGADGAAEARPAG